MAVPVKTRYADSGGVSIAYQVVGEGPIDLVFTQGFVSNVDLWWELPTTVRLMERLASFSRLILWDKRGTGLSDPSARVPTLGERVEDLNAVMDAAGSERAALWGISEGGPMSLLFAASQPERTSALVLYASTPKFSRGPDWPWGWDADEFGRMCDDIGRSWGEGAMAEWFAPSYAANEQFRQTWGRFLRSGASPAMGRALLESASKFDCRDILPAVRVPTLLVHRTGDRVCRVEASRYMAAQIDGAKLVELPGDDHIYTVGDSDAIFDEVEEFLTGIRHVPQTERALLSVLFTDIVGSTRRAAELGDRRWRDLLEAHGAAVRREIARSDGREVKSTGDGFLITFTSPSRAIRCASAIRDRLRGIGVETRAGLHTGECELIGDDVGGLVVHIAARVAALAEPGEVLVSSTVRDLLVGSEMTFTERGTHELKGVPGDWRLFAAGAAAPRGVRGSCGGLSEAEGCQAGTSNQEACLTRSRDGTLPAW